MRFKTITLFSFLAVCGLLLSFPMQGQEMPFWSEDFSGGLPAGWINADQSGNDALWSWCGDPATGQSNGCPAIWDDALNEQSPFAATTAGNGFVVLDSDLAGEVTHISELTTDAIDCSNRDVVFLGFETHIGVFTLTADDNAIIRVSTDQTNWTNFQVFTGVENTGAEDRWSDNPTLASIDISSVAANQSTVYIQWQWTGNFEYHWSVDDAGLYEADPFPLPANDLICSVPAYGPHYATPESQVDSVFFAYTVSNAGLEDQTNVNFVVQVEGDGGQFFTTTETLDVFPAGVTDTIFFAEPYVPDGQGVYTVTYTVSQDEDDAQPNDNLVAAEFQVTESLFANDNNGVIFSGQPADLGGPTYEIGNYYPVVAGGFEAFEIDFSVASAEDVHIGETVTIWLYQFQDDGSNSISDDTMIPVGVGTYTFGEDDVSGNLFTAGIEPLLVIGDAVELEEGEEYFALVEYDSETMSFVYTTNDYPYGQLAIVIRDGSEWSGGFIGGGIIPVVRMRIRSIEGSAVNGVELLDAAVKTFPNPADDQLNARVELPEIAGQLEVRIIDVFGKTHLARTYENFRQDNFEFNTSRLPAGTYYLHLETEKGVKTERFVIQR